MDIIRVEELHREHRGGGTEDTERAVEGWMVKPRFPDAGSNEDKGRLSTNEKSFLDFQCFTCVMFTEQTAEHGWRWVETR